MGGVKDDPAIVELARSALRRRDNLAGAGASIMRSYGLTEKTARELHRNEVLRRKRETQA